MTHRNLIPQPARSRRGAFLPGLLTASLFAALLALATTVPAVAQPGVGAGGHGPKMPGAMLIRGADTDQDGTVTASEWAAQLAALDADGDGIVSSDEAEAFREARRGDRPRRGSGARGDHFARIFDTDGDETVSTTELQAVFDGFDTDGDTAVSGDELPTFRMRRGGRHGGPGGRLLRFADSDENGELTRAEWTAFLASADTDADGSIDADELRTVVENNRPVDREPPALEVETLEGLFNTLDADGNGVVTEDERPAPRHRGPRGGGFGRMHGG